MKLCFQCGKQTTAGKFCSEECREWAHEIAMEAGMLHGMNAYNEALGQATENYERDEYDDY